MSPCCNDQLPQPNWNEASLKRPGTGLLNLLSSQQLDPGGKRPGKEARQGLLPSAVRKYVPPVKEHPAAGLATSADFQPGLPVVFLPHGLLDKIVRHGSADTRRERFGLLIGRVYTAPTGKPTWLELMEMLPARTVRATATYIEVPSQEITRLNLELDRFSEASGGEVQKLGWYHTHPGWDVFMSETDRTNQCCAYRAPWQIALVYDPVRNRYGVFAGPQCLALPPENIVLRQDGEPIPSPLPVYGTAPVGSQAFQAEQAARKPLAPAPAAAWVLLRIFLTSRLFTGLIPLTAHFLFSRVHAFRGRLEARRDPCAGRIRTQRPAFQHPGPPSSLQERPHSGMR